ncbi:MAG: hypothetical protein MJB14_03920 [Spirochaetes bacterium]|nr:hypothetical protein [Spirochaetota bacterium]
MEKFVENYKKMKLTIIILSIFFVLFGCTNYWNSDSITITDLEYKIENIADASYWVEDSDAVEETCFINFWIQYKGDDIVWDFVEYARIYFTNDLYWNIKPTFLDASNKEIGGWNHLLYSRETHSLPIGEMTVRVKLKNGHITTYDKTIGIPNSKSNGSYSYVCTPNNISPLPADYYEILDIATINSGSYDSGDSQIDIDFDVADTKVQNGYLEFYDSDGDFIGYTDTFKTSASGTVIDWLGTFTNSGNNTIAIDNDDHSDDIVFQNKGSFADIYRILIVLTDGSQFSTNDYHYLSRSEKYSIR